MKILDKILGGVFPTNKYITTDTNQTINEIQNVIRDAGLTPEAEVSLTGTASSVGTAITGVGTLFTTELRIGDLFYKDSAINDVRRVTVITDNLNLTVESAFDSDFSGQACSVFNVTQLRESLLNPVVDDLTINNKFNTVFSNSTISSGAIAYINNSISITGEGATTDTLTNITGGVAGDRLKIYCGTGYNITIEHDAAKIKLSTSSNIVMQNGDMLNLYCVGSNIWLEDNRAVKNSNYMEFVTSALASNDATIELTWENDSDFSNYVLLIDYMRPENDATNLNLLVSDDGGSTWKAGAADYQWSLDGNIAEGVTIADGDKADAKITLNDTANSIGNVAGEELVGGLEFQNPSDGTYQQKLNFQVVYKSQAGDLINISGGGVYQANTAINGIQFSMSAGNIALGIFKLYRY